jgi:hypothetical protein
MAKDLKLKFFQTASDNSKIIRILVGLALAVMSFGTFFSAYLQQIYSETISFKVRDGWCDYGTQGFGYHCFGDFYAPMSIASGDNPWASNLHLAYTPLSFSYFRVLDTTFFLNVSTHLPLVLNLMFTLGALLTPGIYIWRNQKMFTSISGKWVALISLTAAPSLIMLDRGSSSFLLYPTVFFFFLGIQKENYRLSSYSVIIMALWKPQSLILSLGILIFFGLRPFILTGIKFVLIFALSFLLYPSGLFKNAIAWFQNSRDYQNYAPNPSPGNYSFVGFIGYLDGFKNLLVKDSSNFIEASTPLSPKFVTLFCSIYALIVILLFVITKNSISKFQFILHSSIFMLTIPGTTFAYYLALMLLPVLLFSKPQIAEALKSRSNRLLWGLYLIFLFFTVPAWPINWGNLPLETGEAFAVLGAHWTLVHMLTSLLVIVSLSQLSLLVISQRGPIRGNPNE